CSVGTGTTLAGISYSLEERQELIGISALKGFNSADAEIKRLVPQENKGWRVLHDFHFGGFAKYTGELIQFMNELYAEHGIPSDIVYTGKLFYAVKKLCGQDFFPKYSRILVIHSGGLAGNLSLPAGTLIF